MENSALAMFRQTVKYDKGNIWIKPVCDLFNLDVQNQYTKIKNDPILGNLYGKNSTDLIKKGNLYGKNNTDLGEIDKNGRILLSKKGFLRWIQIINANTIDIGLKDKFISYQSLIFDYLYGSMEREKQMQVNVTRLTRLEKLHAKIGFEIKQLKGNISLFITEKYYQGVLDLKFPKELKEHNSNN